MELIENSFDEKDDRWGPNIKGIDIVAYEDEDLNFFCAECGDPEAMEPSVADDFISFDEEELELFTPVANCSALYSCSSFGIFGFGFFGIEKHIGPVFI